MVMLKNIKLTTKHNKLANHPLSAVSICKLLRVVRPVLSKGAWSDVYGISINPAKITQCVSHDQCRGVFNVRCTFQIIKHQISGNHHYARKVV